MASFSFPKGRNDFNEGNEMDSILKTGGGKGIVVVTG